MSRWDNLFVWVHKLAQREKQALYALESVYKGKFADPLQLQAILSRLQRGGPATAQAAQSVLKLCRAHKGLDVGSNPACPSKEEYRALRAHLTTQEYPVVAMQHYFAVALRLCGLDSDAFHALSAMDALNRLFSMLQACRAELAALEDELATPQEDAGPGDEGLLSAREERARAAKQQRRDQLAELVSNAARSLDQLQVRTLSCCSARLTMLQLIKRARGAQT